MIRRRAASREDGVALVTVLMIVAAMSTVAIMLSAAVLSSTQRARALDASAQADWFTAGAQELAQVAIEQLVTQSGAALFDGMPALAQPMNFPVEGGGLSLSGRDASNCFNVNTLRMNAAREPGAEGPDRSPRAEFIRLLEAAEFDGFDAEGAASALQDWMDPDQTPGPVEVVDVEPDQLTDPDPGGVEQLEHREVARAGDGLGVDPCGGRVEHGADLARAQRGRQLPARGR